MPVFPQVTPVVSAPSRHEKQSSPAPESQIVAVSRVLLAVVSIALAIASSARAATPQDPEVPVDPPSRSFVFSYVVNVRLPARSHSVRAWIPLPTTDSYQSISELQLQAPAGIQIHEDSESGGHYADFSADPSRVKGPFQVRVTFHLIRYERRVDLPPALPSAANAQTAFPADVAPFLLADRWAPVDQTIENVAAEQTQGLSDPLQKARKIFEYVVSTPGSGYPVERLAGARKACDARGAGCTGFNSLFVSLARAAGIPARLEIGFSVPEGETEGAIPSYHAWTEFYIAGIGWIPLDASMAVQEPAKRDDFFGSIDARRVMIATGSDAQTPSAISALRLSDLVDPRVEIDGKPCAKYSADFFFQELGTDGRISWKKTTYARAHATDRPAGPPVDAPTAQPTRGL